MFFPHFRLFLVLLPQYQFREVAERALPCLTSKLACSNTVASQMFILSHVVSKLGLLNETVHENLCLHIRLVKWIWELQFHWEKTLFHIGIQYLASLGYYPRYPHVLSYWLCIKQDSDPQNGLRRRAGTDDLIWTWRKTAQHFYLYCKNCTSLLSAPFFPSWFATFEAH